jgi:hypothetical protein
MTKDTRCIKLYQYQKTKKLIDQEHHHIVVNYINIIKLCSMDLAAN